MGSCCSKVRRKSKESDLLEGILDYERNERKYGFEPEWSESVLSTLERESRSSRVVTAKRKFFNLFCVEKIESKFMSN